MTEEGGVDVVLETLDLLGAFWEGAAMAPKSTDGREDFRRVVVPGWVDAVAFQARVDALAEELGASSFIFPQIPKPF